MAAPRTTKKLCAGTVFLNVVRPLGLEPRTTEVYQFNSLSARLDSNQGPRRYKLRALPTELQADKLFN